MGGWEGERVAGMGGCEIGMQRGREGSYKNLNKN